MDPVWFCVNLIADVNSMFETIASMDTCILSGIGHVL
jgi:hypothetical protein